MRIFTTSLLLFAALQSTFSQNLTFTKFPLDWQLQQRDLVSNSAIFTASGTVAQSSGYSSLEARLFDEQGQISVLSQNLTFVGGQAAFNFLVSVPAACNNHRLEIHAFRAATNQWFLEKKAEKLLAGDVFIINGQSNAQAAASPDLADVDEYTRSWHEPYGWGTLNLSFPGLWGARLANRIADDIGIPVAIFNQAVGALPIDTYLKNEANPLDGGNYGNLLQRFDDAGLPRRARTAIWFHGEANSWAFESATYKNHFQSLVNSWKSDYSIQQAFLFQMRYQSCNSPRPFIMEAHRQCGDLADVDIMSSTNAAHDSCHFYYENGYKTLGDRMFDLIANRFYGRAVAEVAPPDVAKAYLSAANEITIETKYADSLRVIGNPWIDFQTEGATVAISSGSIVGSTIKLTLAGSAAGVTGISFLGHSGDSPRWIVNSRGVGLLTFANFPLSQNPNNAGVLTFDQPADVSATAAAGATSATVNFSMPNATSTCTAGAAVSQISGATSGSIFPIGTTQVCFRASDACGNQQTRCFNIVVEADGGGSLDCAGIGIAAAGNSISISNLAAPVIGIQVFDNQWVQKFVCLGNCSTPTVEVLNLAAGKYFVKIDYLTAAWQAVCKKEAFVDVVAAPPTDVLTFNQPANISATAAVGATSAVVNFSTPAASSTCSIGTVSVVQISGLVSGASFPVGTLQVCFRASDGCGNSQTRCFNIVVAAAPTGVLTFNQPANVSATAAVGATSAVVNFSTPAASSTCPVGTVSVVQISGLVSGASFPVGTSQVCFRASDGCGNSQTRCFNIVVAAAPTGVLTFNQPANVSATAAVGATSAVVNFPTPAASSTCSVGTVSVVQISGLSSGASFPIGTSQVCFRASDGCGNSQTRCFNVVVAAAPTANIDLELTGSTATPDPAAFTNFSVKFVLKNRGTATATGVRARFPLVSGLAYRGGSEFSLTKGSFILSQSELRVSSLAAGDSAVLTLNYYNLNKNLKNVFGQVTLAGQSDADSSPNNGTAPTPKEDDEAVVKINAPVAVPRPDLELKLTADNPSPGAWAFVNLTLTLKNTGTAAATGVRVNFMNHSDSEIWSKIADAGQTVPAGTTYDSWFGNWDIPSIEPNQSFELKYVGYSKVATEIPLFAEVKTASGSDLDSAPGNAVGQNAIEDDEVKIVLNAGSNLLQSGNRLAEPVPSDLPDLQIFPNPAGEIVSINFEKWVGKTVELAIFDSQGKLQFSEKLVVEEPRVFEIDLSAWKNGEYFLQVGAAGLRRVSKKLVLARKY